jgi:hypothetical protein
MKTGATPIPETPIEEKKRLLAAWAVIVEQECAAIIEEKTKKQTVYLNMKNRYDNWLAKRLRWITKLEKRERERRKQLEQIRTDLAALEVIPPTP